MTVTKIPATRNIATSRPLNKPTKRRVAAYARVSTDNVEQATSYEAQVSYYTDYIKSKSEWEFVKVYTDEGISGTTIKKRLGFQEMMNDALEGKIDLILTKSVSRFARNTVDSLTSVRTLKEKGVEIYFEKENIWTFDSKGELLITIMSSLAQEESRSISENIKWGKRKAFADGKVSICYSSFLGYKKGIDGKPEIDEKEAKVVRLIYDKYIKTQSFTAVAEFLINKHIPTPKGKTKWTTTTIKHILTNEKYIGDALLQKTYIADFLTKKVKVNHGEIPQYYVTNSHPAIISHETFEWVQILLKRHARISQAHNCFSGMIYCKECGSLYGSKRWNSNTKYTKTVWLCNNKYGKKNHCPSKHIEEDTLKAAFIHAYNDLLIMPEKDSSSFDTTNLEHKLKTLTSEMNALYNELDEMLSTHKNLAAFDFKYEDYQNMEEKADSMKSKIQETKVKKTEYKYLLKTLSTHRNPIKKFSEKLFNETVEKLIVDKEGNIEVVFFGM